MNVLKGEKAYLSGPIEHNADRNWRIDPKRVLVEEFGIDLFDPFDDPKQNKTDEILEARKNKDLNKIRQLARDFVRKDLSNVDSSKFLIAYLPYQVPTTGTCDEIFTSNRLKKPTLLVCPQGVEFIPFWYFAFIRLEYMFGNWNALYEYLREVNEGKHKKDDRWAIVYGLI